LPARIGAAPGALVAAASLFILGACAGATEDARNSLTPIVTMEVPGAIDPGQVVDTTAMQTAAKLVEAAGEALFSAGMPGDPIASLATAGSVASWAQGRRGIPGDYEAATGDTLVWAVQIEGQWRAAADSPPNARSDRFAVVAIHTQTGRPVAAAVSPDPYMAPRQVRGKTRFDCVVWETGPGQVSLGPDRAVEAVRQIYPEGALDKFENEWDVERADAQIVRCVESAGGVDRFRFRWFVTLMSQLELQDCSTPSVRAAELKRRCWGMVGTHLVDGITGEVEARNETEYTGPLLTDTEFEKVETFAGVAGWWEAWARLRNYKDTIVPAAVFQAMVAQP
jgi:hypothetical protein